MAIMSKTLKVQLSVSTAMKETNWDECLKPIVLAAGHTHKGNQ